MSDNSNVVQQDISEKLAHNYTQYALSVITDRAIPDIRDGLKPVQRRILYSMGRLRLSHNKPPKKSARLVGDVLGFFHPHGDQSVYDASVRMAQDFNMKHTLVDGQGNMGSIDGDTAAAMRYTEVRMSKIGESMLHNIDKDTVDYTLNFDNTTKEPTVLPTLFPNLLVNGGSGIAVGMSYSMPTHNAYDVYMALDYMIQSLLDGNMYDIDDLIDIIKAPDFPTGGNVIYNESIRKGYETGRGSVQIKAKCEIEKEKNKHSIIITEIPYAVNKSTLVSKMDELRHSRIPEIREVIDESSKEGIRIVVDLKRGEDPNLALAKLYKYTQLKSSVSMNFTVLNNNKPVVADLKFILESFIEHSLVVLTRELEYDLSKANDRKHVLEGMAKCLDNIDEAIETIKNSNDNKETTENLMAKFDLTEPQAKALGDTRLRGLNKVSKSDVFEELSTLNNNIEEWQDLLNNELSLLKKLQDTYADLRGEFSNQRNSTIIYSDKFSDVTERDLVKEEDVVITLTSNGIIKSTLESDYKVSNRNTKGSKSISIDEDDYVRYMFSANTKSNLLIITDRGIAHKLDVFQIPITSRTAKGKFINQYINLGADETILDVIEIDEEEDISNKYVVMITKQGTIKKMAVENTMTTRDSARVIEFNEGDSLVKAMIVEDSNQEVFIVTAGGVGLKTNIEDMRPIKGRSAKGVLGIKLREDDYVVDMASGSDDSEILLVCSRGIGKRLDPSKVNSLGRNAFGVKVINILDRTGPLINALNVNPEDTILLSTMNGLVVKTDVDDITLMGRASSGVKIVNLNDNDVVVATCVGQQDSEDNEDKVEE